MVCKVLCTGIDAPAAEELERVVSSWGWDNGHYEATPRHLHISHEEFKFPLWLSYGHNPVWVDVPAVGCTLAQRPGAFVASGSVLQVEKCRKLCEDGLISDAVDALQLLVQQGCRVPNNIFYQFLKRCMRNKDLLLGKRIHALTLRSGYEGDAFLATHLMGLYASHGRLEEAVQVFSKVASPSPYNWATIIFAYARHGEVDGAAEAIRLYRQMCESTTIQPDNRLFSAVLKACAVAKDLAAGREVHAHILATSGRPDKFVQAGLVDMYAKCGSLDDARRLFDKLLDRDIVTWTAMIGGYAQQGMGEEAVNLYRNMQQEGLLHSNSVTYVCLLQACASIGEVALDEGKKLHAEIGERGLQRDMVVAISLVNMYAKCGSLEYARMMFDKLPERNIVAWNGMLAGYTHQGMYQEAFGLYRNMQQEGLTPNSVTYACMLKACARLGAVALGEGKQLHTQLKEQGLEEDVVLGGSLVDMYVKCGSLEKAHVVFNKLSCRKRNVVTWTSMIAAYAQHGMGQKALALYSSMQQEGHTAPNSVTYLCLLQACATVGETAFDEGKQLHAEIKARGLQKDKLLAASLVQMYVKCGSLEDACKLFETLADRDVVTWTLLISGYAQQGMGKEARSLYRRMQLEGLTPDSVTYVCMLQACASTGIEALDEGKHLHAEIEKQGLQDDVALGGGLVNMYAKCGSLGDARKLFDNLPERNIVAWNAMISAYAQKAMGLETISLYSTMQREGPTPNSVTYVCLLQACASVGAGALGKGKQLHAEIEKQGLEEDATIGASLVNMYVKCGSLEEARIVFDKATNKDVVTWTTMISGYAQHGMVQEAFFLYSRMQQEGLPPNSVTYVCLLQACAAVGALSLGEQLHAEIKENGTEFHATVGAALVNMYAKAGSMSKSQRVFDSLSERSTGAWGALVCGYAHEGDSQAVFDLFDKMTLEGVQPNEIMFLGILTVCSHEGLVDEGRKYFEVMRVNYGVSATMEHFICMVDLLGRAGHLEEALQMAESVPFRRCAAVWHALLSACLKWKDVEMGQHAFNCAVSLDDKDAAPYVLMSNIYASAEKWAAAKEMQTRRLNLGAWKDPGHSWWTDMAGVVHMFLVGDEKYPESFVIHAKLSA